MRPVFAATVVFSTLFIDLSSKWFVAAHIIASPGMIPVMPFFNFVLVYNRGVSFGLFSSDSPYVPYALSTFALGIIIVLLVVLWRSRNLLHTVGYAAIIGGALSNVIDRLHDGAVTDFLDFYVGQYHWPAFNFADAFILFGVIAVFFPYANVSVAKQKPVP